MSKWMIYVACAVVIVSLMFSSSGACQSTLSQNSGINSADTWATLDVTTQTQAVSTSLTRPTITQTYHLELGYDASGQFVVNLWPTGTGGNIGSDAGQVSVIRLAGGNVTLFDQNGAPIPYVSPVSNAPAFNPLNLLGTNPGSSILSQLVVSNIQQQAQTTKLQLSWSGSNALLSGPMQYTESSGNCQWTYAQSGSVWIATQVSFSLTESNVSVTRTLQFSNVHWTDNAANDSARAQKGSTAVAPPSPTTSTPATLTAPSSSNCPPYLSNLSGTQNVVFQHGFFSSGCTWSRMIPWLNQQFLWGTELVPSLNSIDNLTNQGNALVSDINSAGGTGYILLGHSQGGLISRYAAQHFENQNPPPNPPVVAGVLSLDTPHQGAPLAALAQGEFQNVFLGDMVNVWGDVGCSTPYDNVLCYLVALQYSALSEQLINIGALTDLVPGSAFLTNLNSQPENFQKAAIIGNTPLRWIEVRVAAEFLKCNPEDSCGERNVASIYGIVYDTVQVSWDVAELVCIATDDPTACAVADYLLPVWVDMDIADLDYNILSADLADEDGIVPSSSQTYPSSVAIQYPVTHADSHMGATKSDRSRNALEQALIQTFRVQTVASCTFSASPPSFSVSSSAATGSFSLTTSPGCQWSAVSQDAWIAVTSGASGNSSGPLYFSVATNPTTIPRNGTIVVGNGSSTAVFTIQQAGVCTYFLSAQTFGIPSGGGTGTINVYTENGCVWSAVPNATWITISSGASGTGNGSFTFSAASNSGNTSLIGTITVMSQTLTVILGNPVGTPGTASVAINGSPDSTLVCNPDCSSCRLRSCFTKVYEDGSVTVTVGGDSFSAYYYGTESSSQLASDLANQINSSSLVSASVSGSTITLTSKLNGSNTNYSLSTSYGFDTTDFSSPAFTAAPSGPTLTGGTD